MLDPSLLENLDCSWPDDLRAYATKLRAMEVAPEDETTRRSLAEYATIKASAMELCASGNVLEAARLEGNCDAIYNRLPDYAKW